MLISRSYVEKYWLPSIGEKLDRVHFREPPPGTGHAECVPDGEYCEVHFDYMNPHQDPFGHLLFDSPEILIGISAGGLAGGVVYARRKNVGEAILVACGSAILSYLLAKVIKGLLT